MVQQIAALRMVCFISASPCRPKTRLWAGPCLQNPRCGATKVRLRELLALRRSSSTPTCPPSTPLYPPRLLHWFPGASSGALKYSKFKTGVGATPLAGPRKIALPRPPRLRKTCRRSVLVKWPRKSKLL